jgi:hypothetical protein
VKPSTDNGSSAIHVPIRDGLDQEPFQEGNYVVTTNPTKSPHESRNSSINISTNQSFLNDTNSPSDFQNSFIKNNSGKNRTTTCTIQQSVSSRIKSHAGSKRHLNTFSKTNNERHVSSIRKSTTWNQLKDIDENTNNSLEHSSFLDLNDATTKDIGRADKLYTVSNNTGSLKTLMESNYEQFNKNLHQLKDTTTPTQESNTDEMSQLYEPYELSQEYQHEDNEFSNGYDNTGSFSSQSHSCHSIEEKTLTSYKEPFMKLGSIKQKTFNRLMRLKHDDAEQQECNIIDNDKHSYSSEDTNGLWMYLPEDGNGEPMHTNPHSPCSHDKYLIRDKHVPTRRILKSQKHSFVNKCGRNRI